MKIRTTIGLLIFANITIWFWYLFLRRGDMGYAQLLLTNYKEYLGIFLLALVGIVLIEK